MSLDDERAGGGAFEAATEEGGAGSRWTLKMKDLSQETGLARQAIHFYIQQGLLPPGRKTGRNMAYYGPEHVERLKVIKRLQHERFLPLKAIKALLDGQDQSFSADQRHFLLGVKQHMREALAKEGEGGPEAVPVAPLLRRLGIREADFEDMVELGFVGRKGEGEEALIRKGDVWMLEAWAEIQELGFAKELGFSVRDVLIYEEAIQALFQKEVQLVASRMSGLEPRRVATMVERALPLVSSLISGMHAAKVRNLFDTIA